MQHEQSLTARGVGPSQTIEVRYVPIEDLTPAPYNPRVMPPQEMSALRRSLETFGFVDPVLVRAGDKMIIGGHQRVEAARMLGIERVPVIELDVTDEEAKALNVALNRISGEFDIPKLAELLEGLPDELVALTGIGDREMQRVLREAEAAIAAMQDEDSIPEPPDEAITQPGDLWILGDHRLLCADSSSASDVDRLLGGATIQLINSDPPYNVKVEPRSNNAIAAGLSSFPASSNHHQQLDVARHPGKAKATHKKLRPKDRPLANDFVSDEHFDTLLRAWFGNMSRVLDPGRSFYVWGGYANLANYPSALEESDFYFSQAIVWDKQHPVLTRKDFMGAFELAFYGWKKGGPHVFYGPNNATDLWSIHKLSPQKMVHLTEKPVELAVRAIDYSSRKGENVLDLFGGSGSTLIACEQTNRRAYLMEIDALYVDVIVQRYEQFTGRTAERKSA